MLQKLKQVNWILLVLITLGLRSVYAADVAQALIVISFSSVYSLTMYLKTKEVKSLNDEVKNQLDEMKTVVGGLAMKNAVKPQQMHQEIKRFF